MTNKEFVARLQIVADLAERDTAVLIELLIEYMSNPPTKEIGFKKMIDGEQIVQLTGVGDLLYGLSSTGTLYYWNKNMNNWTKAGE